MGWGGCGCFHQHEELWRGTCPNRLQGRCDGMHCARIAHGWALLLHLVPQRSFNIYIYVSPYILVCLPSDALAAFDGLGFTFPFPVPPSRGPPSLSPSLFLVPPLRAPPYGLAGSGFSWVHSTHYTTPRPTRTPHPFPFSPPLPGPPRPRPLPACPDPEALSGFISAASGLAAWRLEAARGRQEVGATRAALRDIAGNLDKLVGAGL